MDLVLVKLGGSLITDKRGEAAVRADVVDRLAAEIAAARPRLEWEGTGILLGHGSGSFGHVAAARYGLGEGLVRAGERGDPAGVAVTQDQAARLHRIVSEHELQSEETGCALGCPAPAALTTDATTDGVTLTSEHGTSSIRALGDERTASVRHLPSNANLMHPHASVPLLSGAHEPGTHDLCCAVLASDRPDSAPVGISPGRYLPRG